MWKRNPDAEQLRLEREYAASGNLYDGVKLLNHYIRSGDEHRAEQLLSEVDAAYQSADTPEDLTLEALIINSYFALGKTTEEICGGRTVICKYDKTLIWDLKQGFPVGTTQSWIDAINQELVNLEWVDSMPVWYTDRIYHGLHSPDSFEATKTPHYATALFHDHHRPNTGWFRVVWNRIYIPDITQDSVTYNKHWTLAETKLMLEHDPYTPPKISAGYFKDRASHGRHSNGGSFTKRVPIEIGTRKALETVERLANKIYFAQDFEEVLEASGTDLYYPPE